jgi:hypothetical protein
MGVVAAAVVVATTTGLFAGQAEARTPSTVQCYERYVNAPIDEKGIQCPGNPAIWKSYTFASSGIGYYTESEDLGGGRSQLRIGYKHRDGRIAISYLDCVGSTCTETYWNGVPFPFST